MDSFHYFSFVDKILVLKELISTEFMISADRGLHHPRGRSPASGESPRQITCRKTVLAAWALPGKWHSPRQFTCRLTA